MKWLLRAALGVALVLLAALAYRLLGVSLGSGASEVPDPAEVLARIGTPPSPVLSPQEALDSFRVADGFRIELVAAEPLVIDPVAISWDDEGRIYVAEMRGFMRDIEGDGEDEPTGRIVVLEDADGDGAMDRSSVFLDGLVLPRAVAVRPEGVLVAEPGVLWLCRDADADLRCENNEKYRLLDYAFEGNVEHSENALVAGLDNWIYNAKSDRRFRFTPDAGELEVGSTAFRGQWGIDQDDTGRFYYNNNSTWLNIDAFPAHDLARHPGTTPADNDVAGIATNPTSGEGVHGIRVAPGVNRATTPGELRDDGRLARPTAVSGLAVQRSDAFGTEMRGDVFVPEPGNQVVAHFRVRSDGLELATEHILYPDAEWEQREFLASSDERFRPVDIEMGPDGALYVIDMYRGVIQHATYVSSYLADYVEKQGLATPVGLGRIYRIVRETSSAEQPEPDIARANTEALVDLLGHENAWWRLAAQRRLVFERDAFAADAVREALDGERVTRSHWIHGLWTLEGLGALDAATWSRAIAHSDPEVTLAAIDAGMDLLLDPESAELVDTLTALSTSADLRVRHRALLAMGNLSVDRRPLATMVATLLGDADSRAFQQAFISGTGGIEVEALTALLREVPSDADAAVLTPLLEDYARASLLQLRAYSDTRALSTMLAVIDELSHKEQQLWRKTALLKGLWRAARQPDFERWELASRPALFRTEDADGDGPLARALLQARRAITWPDDDLIIGAAPLTPEQEALMESGAPLYEACQICHGENGAGQESLAPTLVQSPWVIDSPEWLARIVLGGIAGPIDVFDEQWNLAMPPHGADPRFQDDAQVAGFLTWLRRSWGNTAPAVDPEIVRAAREDVAKRQTPWTAADLFAVPTEHRLDAFLGDFKIKGFPLTVTVTREGDKLAFDAGLMGSSALTALPDGSHYTSHPERGDLRVRFLDSPDGGADAMLLELTEQTVTLERVN